MQKIYTYVFLVKHTLDFSFLCFSDNFEKYFFTVYMGVASNIVQDIGELLS